MSDGIAIPALGGGPPRGLLLIDELAELRGAARDVAALDLRLHHLEREILIGESRRLRLLIIGQRVRIFLLIEGDRPAHIGIIADFGRRSEEHTSELQSIMRTSYA